MCMLCYTQHYAPCKCSFQFLYCIKDKFKARSKSLVFECVRHYVKHCLNVCIRMECSDLHKIQSKSRQGAGDDKHKLLHLRIKNDYLHGRQGQYY
jgi:hypothetical protein